MLNQESILENDILANHEFSIEELTNIIKKSIPNTALKSHFYEPKNKWFNTDCFNARNKSLKWLRKFQKSSDILEKEKYIKATKKYKAVRNRARLKYLQDLNVKINQVHSIKDWWKIANEI